MVGFPLRQSSCLVLVSYPAAPLGTLQYEQLAQVCYQIVEWPVAVKHPDRNFKVMKRPDASPTHYQ